ncbi:pilus assembly protein TadG-related protein [Asticcacaulis sp.]|uniref:pilus assembly protein TadG-related protein n=1 Tax=Asticcacaulis sp. TaxID=1872648 RepID=UPI002C3FD467|nr:pilus assembly protein TadG-related protein [Asticcacaulis sp.]HTM79849.1 pilus assembly protein TadG-related protein [Asticcacaulis sp.]
MDWAKFCKHLRRTRRDTGGNVSLIAAFSAIPLVLAVTGVIEITDMSNARGRLQEAADAGALAGAGQLAIATIGAAQVSQTAVTVAEQSIGTSGQGSRTTPPAFTATVDTHASSVTVTGVAEHKPLIGFMDFGNQALTATATAENVQRVPLCILQTDDSGGIKVQDTARIRATGCAIHANADINVASGALIQAEAAQAVGAVSGPIEPAGHSGALPIDDPFAAMDLKSKTLCNLLEGHLLPIQLGSGTMSLPPGLHCLPITVIGNGTLFLQPGDHYFFGPLIMTDNSTLRGDDVSLVFGVGNVFNFARNANVRLSARKSGPMAGFLIATSRDNFGTFSIASGNVSQLLGTIYIPNANLVVDTPGNVAQNSAWSVIVAKTLTLKQNPVLTINTNYTGSGVPVPEGVGPMKAAPRLSH